MNNNQFLFTTDNSSFNSSSLEDISLSTTEEEDKLPNTLKLKKIKKSKNNIETNNENNISSLTNQMMQKVSGSMFLCQRISQDYLGQMCLCPIRTNNAKQCQGPCSYKHVLVAMF